MSSSYGVEIEDGMPVYEQGDAVEIEALFDEEFGDDKMSREASVLEFDKPEMWQTVEVVPEGTEAGFNIRDVVSRHVLNLGRSMLKQTQMQECIGDIGPDGVIRIWGGRHRRLAIINLNIQAAKRGWGVAGKEKDGWPSWKRYWVDREIRVRVYQGQFTPEQIFQVQMAENLHAEMTPLQEALAIRELWDRYRDLFGQQAVKKDLASRIGRSDEKVYAALALTRADRGLVYLVRAGAIPYGIAVYTASSFEDNEKQIQVATYIIERGLTYGQAKIFIQDSKRSALRGQSEEGEVEAWATRARGLPLLGDQAVVIEEGDALYSLQGKAGHAAKSGTGYLLGLIHLMEVIGDPYKVRVTDAALDTIDGLILAARYFMERIKELHPEMATEIQEAVDAKEAALERFGIDVEAYRRAQELRAFWKAETEAEEAEIVEPEQQTAMELG